MLGFEGKKQKLYITRSRAPTQLCKPPPERGIYYVSKLANNSTTVSYQPLARPSPSRADCQHRRRRSTSVLRAAIFYRFNRRSCASFRLPTLANQLISSSRPFLHGKSIPREFPFSQRQPPSATHWQKGRNLDANHCYHRPILRLLASS